MVNLTKTWNGESKRTKLFPLSHKRNEVLAPTMPLFRGSENARLLIPFLFPQQTEEEEKATKYLIFYPFRVCMVTTELSPMGPTEDKNGYFAPDRRTPRSFREISLEIGPNNV